MDTTSNLRPRRRGPKLPELVLTEDERATLQRRARRAKSSQALALRCRIVLACAEGVSNAEVVKRLGVSRPTVTKWRSRFVARRLEGLADEPRPGAARTITDTQVEQVLVTTLEARPADATHWSTRSLARQLGMSQSAISRIWRAFGLKPHLVDTFKLSTDPQFIDKVATSLACTSTHPRRRWCCALTRRRACRRWTAPPRSCRCCQESPQRATHDYTRHGVTNLYAALDVASGKVISQLPPHRAIEFKRFLALVDAQVPAGLDLHVICDNSSTHKTPAIQQWLLGRSSRAPALHPDLQLVAEPGRAVVRRADQQVAASRHPPLGCRADRLDPGLDRGLEPEPAAVRVGPGPPTRSSTPSPPTASTSTTRNTSCGRHQRASGRSGPRHPERSGPAAAGRAVAGRPPRPGRPRDRAAAP